MLERNFSTTICRKQWPRLSQFSDDRISSRFPSRTRKLSLLEPMILQLSASGKVGSRRIYIERESAQIERTLLSFRVQTLTAFTTQAVPRRDRYSPHMDCRSERCAAREPCSSIKKPTPAATIIARPANANERGPPKIPKKNATTPNAANAEPA